MARIETITRELFTFDELSAEAQAKAIENNYDFNVGDSWWYEYPIEDAKMIARLLGFDVENIYFSGFSSQGDGACATGDYSYKKGALKAVKTHAPQDERLHRIAKDLQDAQRRAFYGLACTVKHSGNYSHEYCVNFDSYQYNRAWASEDYTATVEQEESIKEPLRDFMRWIYRQLQNEYDFQTSDESIKDSLIGNAIEFTKDGENAH